MKIKQNMDIAVGEGTVITVTRRRGSLLASTYSGIYCPPPIEYGFGNRKGEMSETVETYDEFKVGNVVELRRHRILGIIPTTYLKLKSIETPQLGWAMES